MSKEFMGAGWKFPVRVGPDRKIALSRAEEDIREAILIILHTAKGERVMRPDFGCGINELVFEPLNQVTFNRVETTVREALLHYEPRIDVTSVYVSEAVENAEKGKLQVNIEYSVKSTNGHYNLVYDFYLEEG